MRCIGLDLGARSLKLVEVELLPHGVRLVNSLIQELPEGQAVDRAGWLQTALEAFKAKEVHVAVSGSEVAVRRLRLPAMPAREVPEAAKWQAKDQLPFPVQEAVIDCALLGEVWEKDLRKQEVLLAAAPDGFVRAQAALVQRAGARVASLVPGSCAAWWAAAALVPQLQQGSVAVVDFGASETHVTIVKDGQVRLVRDVAVGSLRLAEALMGVVAGERGEVTIDFPRAELFRRRYGVLTEAAAGATDEGVPLFHLASLMRPVLEHLLTELSRLLSFYKVQMEEAGVSRVLLCGGAAGMKSLPAFLADGLGVTVEVFNPLVRITDRLQPLEPEQIAEQGPRLAGALGAAISCGQQLNLLPPPLRQASRATGWQAVAHRSLAAAALAAAVVAAGLMASLAMTHRQLARDRRQWEALQPHQARYLHVTAARKRAESARDATQRFLDDQPLWDSLFKEVAALLPPSLVLEELAAGPDERTGAWTFHLTGRALPGAADAQEQLSEFVEALNRSPFMARVELVHSEVHAGGNGVMRFEVEGGLP